MIRKSLLLGIAGLMALGVFALGGDGARAGTGSMAAMSLDTDITGNTSTSIGTVEECAEVNAGDQVTIDLLADGIPATNKMIAYGATVTLPNLLTASSLVSNTGLIASAPGSTAASASDPVPATGAFLVSAFDTNVTPPDFDAAESGDGILARMVIDIDAGAADGIYNINLSDGSHVDTAQTAWPPDVSTGARLAVGAITCTTAFMQGDVDCNNLVNAVDSLKVLRSNAALLVSQNEPCDDIGTGTPKQGDVDCNGSVTAVDSLKLLRYGASLSVSQTEPCPDIGTPNTP